MSAVRGQRAERRPKGPAERQILQGLGRAERTKVWNGLRLTPRLAQREGGDWRGGAVLFSFAGETSSHLYAAL